MCPPIRPARPSALPPPPSCRWTNEQRLWKRFYLDDSSSASSAADAGAFSARYVSAMFEVPETVMHASILTGVPFCQMVASTVYLKGSGAAEIKIGKDVLEKARRLLASGAASSGNGGAYMMTARATKKLHEGPTPFAFCLSSFLRTTDPACWLSLSCSCRRSCRPAARRASEGARGYQATRAGLVMKHRLIGWYSVATVVADRRGHHHHEGGWF